MFNFQGSMFKEIQTIKVLNLTPRAARLAVSQTYLAISIFNVVHVTTGHR